MTDYRLTREEMETVIRGNAASQTWDVCTADPWMIRRMERQGYKPDDRQNPWGYVSFTVPFSRVSIRKAEKRKTALGELKRKQAEAKRALLISDSGNQTPPAMVG